LAQYAVPHVVEAFGRSHALGFEPLHVPAQAPDPTHAARPLRGRPATVLHWPTLPNWLHAWHWPVQSLSQHTPSTQ
jgi:hypothetical protein